MTRYTYYRSLQRAALDKALYLRNLLAQTLLSISSAGEMTRLKGAWAHSNEEEATGAISERSGVCETAGETAVQLLSRAIRVLQAGYSILALALLIASSIATGEAATHQDDRYASSRFGIPGTIGGYAVLAVLTEGNFVCMKPGERRLVLQSLHPSIDSALRSFPKERSELAHWESSIVGSWRETGAAHKPV